MIVRELLTRIGYQVDDGSAKKAKSSFDGLKKAAIALGATISAGAVFRAFQNWVGMASDVEETMNVVTTAFEDQTGAVLDWARTTGEAVGRSEFSLREYAATIGAVVGPTLDSADATAELSTDMAKLAVDLGSFFNATDTDALEALRSGLIGQAEPLLRFGVAMNVAALDAFALEQGLGKTTRQMSQAEKITLRYRFIMDQTAKAQGDAEKTSGGFANQAKRLEESLKTLRVGLGQQLLPIALGLVEAFNGLGESLRGPVVSGFRLMVAPIKGLGRFIELLLEGIRQMPSDLKILTAAFIATWAVVLAPGLLVYGLLALIGTAILAVVDDLNAMGDGGKSVIGGLVGEFTYWLDQTDSILSAIGQIFKNTVDYWVQYFFGIENAIDKTVDALVSFYDAIVKVFVDGFGLAADKVKELTALLERTGVMDTLAGLASGLGFNLGGPAPQRRLAGGGAGATNVTAPQNIEVIVNAGNASPEQTAQLAGRAVGAAAGAANRRLQHQLRAGGGT